MKENSNQLDARAVGLDCTMRRIVHSVINSSQVPKAHVPLTVQLNSHCFTPPILVILFARARRRDDE